MDHSQPQPHPLLWAPCLWKQLNNGTFIVLISHDWQLEPYVANLVKLTNDCVNAAPNDTSLRLCAPYRQDPALYWRTVLPPLSYQMKQPICPPIATFVYLVMDQQYKHILASLQLV